MIIRVRSIFLRNSRITRAIPTMQNAVKEYEQTGDSCTSWPLEEVTHVFYHTLIKDTSKAFDGDYKEADYNQVMTTIDEFNKDSRRPCMKRVMSWSVFTIWLRRTMTVQ